MNLTIKRLIETAVTIGQTGKFNPIVNPEAFNFQTSSFRVAASDRRVSCERHEKGMLVQLGFSASRELAPKDLAKALEDPLGVFSFSEPPSSTNRLTVNAKIFTDLSIAAFVQIAQFLQVKEFFFDQRDIAFIAEVAPTLLEHFDFVDEREGAVGTLKHHG